MKKAKRELLTNVPAQRELRCFVMRTGDMVTIELVAEVTPQVARIIAVQFSGLASGAREFNPDLAAVYEGCSAELFWHAAQIDPLPKTKRKAKRKTKRKAKRKTKAKQ